MNKFLGFFARLWSFSVVRHLVSASVAVAVSTGSIKAGMEEQQARELGAAAGEVVRTIPAP